MRERVAPPEGGIQARELRREIRRRVDRDIGGFEEWYSSRKGERYRQAEEEAVLRALDLAPESTLIDAGCGGGRFSLLLAPRCRLVRAVDFSPVAVETTLARARLRGIENVTGAVADLVDGIPGEPADRVLSVQVLPLIPTPADRLKALAGLRGALRPGGKLVLTAFNGGRLADRIRGRRRELVDAADARNTWCYRYFFEPRELESLLRAAGFGEIRVRPAVNLPGRVYRLRGSRLLAPLDRLLERLPPGRALGIYLVASGLKR